MNQEPAIQSGRPKDAENAVAYYRAHGPEKTVARVGLAEWKPVLLEMIKDRLTRDEIHEWMAEHAAKLGFRVPAKTTLRDWLASIRKDRKNAPEGSGETIPASAPVPAPPAAITKSNQSDELSEKTPEEQLSGVGASPEEVYKKLPRNPDGSIKIEPSERKLPNLAGYRA